jgi:hypothetical protein
MLKPSVIEGYRCSFALFIMYVFVKHVSINTLKWKVFKYKEDSKLF